MGRLGTLPSIRKRAMVGRDPGWMTRGFAGERTGVGRAGAGLAVGEAMDFGSLLCRQTRARCAPYAVGAVDLARGEGLMAVRARISRSGGRRASHRLSDTEDIPRRMAASFMLCDVRSAVSRNVAFSISSCDRQA